MSCDMSNNNQSNTERKIQIVQNAIDIIAHQGYSQLSMRAVARKSELKLGALQYHYPKWENLLKAIADYIIQVYYLDTKQEYKGSMDLEEILIFILDDPIKHTIPTDKLFPQLWAMTQVEPIMKSLMNEIYEMYFNNLKKLLEEGGAVQPRIQALVLMSFLEGTTLFISKDSKWENDAENVKEFALDYIKNMNNFNNDKKEKL